MDIEKAIKTLLGVTKHDPDAVSCLTLGEHWDTAKGTVFVVRDIPTAKKLFKFLLVQGLVSDQPALAPPPLVPEEALAAKLAVDANRKAMGLS